jgi:DNA polymerase-1
MTPYTLEAYELMHRSSLVLAKAERAGIHVDIDYCHRMQRHLGRQIERLDAQLADSEIGRVGRATYGRTLNLNSDDQLATILFDKMKFIPTERTEPSKTYPEGKPSCRAEALEALTSDVPELDYLLRRRKLAKAKDTYLANFVSAAVDGVMHPFFRLDNVVTFRSSSSMPNFQNIPNRDPEIRQICRRAIKPKKGRKLVSIDFSGVEVRVANCYHKDPTMTKYNTNPESDMHRDMAMEIYLIDKHLMDLTLALDKQNGTKYYKAIRNSGKSDFVFPEFYGDWYKTCAWALWFSAKKDTHMLPGGVRLIDHLASKKIECLEDFERHMKRVENHFWNKRFPQYTKWKDDWWSEYQKRGYIDTLTGFRCQGVMRRNEVINYPIQGSAFHLTLSSMIDIDDFIVENRFKSEIIGQIHDELIVDEEPGEEADLLGTIKEIMTTKLMEKYKWILVPIDVEIAITEIDQSWYDKKEIHL